MDRMSRLIVTEATISTISWWIALAKSVQEMQEFNDRANIYHSTMLIQHGEAASDGENMQQKFCFDQVARRCSGVVLHLRGLGVGFSYKCDQSKRRQPACQATTVRPGEKNQMTPP